MCDGAVNAKASASEWIPVAHQRDERLPETGVEMKSLQITRARGTRSEQSDSQPDTRTPSGRKLPF